MLNNYYVINKSYRIVLFLLFCTLGFSMPVFGQVDSNNTPVITEPSEPVEEPSTNSVEENPTTTEENPTTTTTIPSTTTTTTIPSTTTTSTTTPEPVVVYDNPVTPVQSNPRRTNQPATPEPITEDENADYNPFELVKNGNSFYNEPIIEDTEDDEPEPEVAVVENEPEPADIPMEERNLKVDTTNPFELVQNGNLSLFVSAEGAVAKKKTSAKNKPKKKAKRKKRKPLFDGSKLNYEAFVKFFGLLMIMGFLSFLTNSFRNDLQKIYRAFTNSNMMTQLYREKGSLINMPYIPLYILFAFTGGTLVYLITDYYNVRILEHKGLSLLLCIIGIGGFYLFKHLLLKLMSIIFPFQKEINQYHFLIGIFNQITGLALIPLVTIIAFAPQNIKLFAIYGALGVIGIIFLNRLFRSIVIASKFIAFHKFHLIVYLCAVEIAPIFIIAKLLMG